ncbi:MAG TPA: hypothetical protein PKA99_03720, partial [Dermatophilaceae bacterium]|nr:hypothetical protein [Dermatophilaceae bacterium]
MGRLPAASVCRHASPLRARPPPRYAVAPRLSLSPPALYAVTPHLHEAHAPGRTDAFGCLGR